jgi:hypothetical protein
MLRGPVKRRGTGVARAADGAVTRAAAGAAVPALLGHGLGDRVAVAVDAVVERPAQPVAQRTTASAANTPACPLFRKRSSSGAVRTRR